METNPPNPCKSTTAAILGRRGARVCPTLGTVREAGGERAVFLRSDPKIADNRSVSRLLPPSAKRARSARALGLRPRSGLLTLAGIASIFGALLGPRPIVVQWLSNQLNSVFSQPHSGLAAGPGLADGSAAGLLALLGALTIAVVAVAPRRRARRALDVGPEAETIPVGVAVVLTLAATLVIVALDLPLLAGAARSADATTGALATVWIAWIRRGLFALAVGAAAVGLIERRISGRRLWRGLHQTLAQARREARSASARR